MKRMALAALAALATITACPKEPARPDAATRMHEAVPATRSGDAGSTAAAQRTSDGGARAEAGTTGPVGRPALPPAPPEELGPPKKTAAELVPGKGSLWAVFRTNHGVMIARLYEKQAPVAVANFVGLATGQQPYLDPKTGQVTTSRYYDGTIFHRVIAKFMIQGGDPTGTGRGGPGYQFANEKSRLRFDAPGVLGMANSGPDTNGSQFFVTEVPEPHLNGGYTIFGKLVRGLPVVKEIARVKKGPGNRPVEPVVLEHLEIVRSPRAPKP